MQPGLSSPTTPEPPPPFDGTTYVVGTLPPPIGGVTVFVNRRMAQLRRMGRQPVLKDWNRMTVFQRIGWLLHACLHPAPAIYELNGRDTLTILAILLRPFPKHLVYWVHSGQFTYRLQGWRRAFFKLFLRHVDELVPVSEHIYQMFADNGFALPANHRVQYAFLPPVLEDEPRHWATYDADTVRFTETRSPLLVMQGSNAFYEGVDRYGSDVGIEMMRHLVKDYPTAGLLIGRPSEGDGAFQTYYHDLLRRVAEYGLTEHVHFMIGERVLWPLTKAADVFVRPSNQDGDSISVREAMHFAVPVVAGDACPRPEGTFLFASRDPEDFARAVRAALAARQPRSPRRPFVQRDRAEASR